MSPYALPKQEFDRPAGPIVPSWTEHLVREGYVSTDDLIQAVTEAQRRGLRLPDMLSLGYGVSALNVVQAIAMGAGGEVIHPLKSRPDPALVAHWGAQACLYHRVLPWRRQGGCVIVLAANSDTFGNAKSALEARFGPVRMALTTDNELTSTISTIFGAQLATAAESKVAAADSSRNWNSRRAGLWIAGMLAVIAISGWYYPKATLGVLTGWAIISLFANTALKLAALVATLRETPARLDDVTPARLPKISLLIPLFKEKEIAGQLMERLQALDYPRELLDVCLIMEKDDPTTRGSLGETALPSWMRAVIVPEGALRTKPRALNYALDFATGSIVGVYDAEDAPAPDQLHRVAQHFANRGPDVACLQGILDYYNAPANWLTRCFTIEYASWFRVVLPGLARMGLVVPLGGTTLFFRRTVLEALGGWDAHNVTEDADLGVRLARRGYRTELIATTTEEEANGQVWPWVKQRSRWLKGYAMTYAVHMRSPCQLWRDLGARRFWGVQVLFAGTLSQFLLAPVIWSFWLIPFGFAHPLRDWMTGIEFWLLIGLFALSEIVSLIVGIVGARRAKKTWLTKWVPTLHVYFPLAAIAAYKGILELAWKPFFWDKTAHGIFLPQAPIVQPEPLPRPTSIS